MNEPYSLEAEQSVLGALLIDGCRKINPASLGLAASDFYLPEHETTFTIMLELSNHNKPVDFVTVLEALQATGTYSDVDGKAYLLQLAQMVPSVVDANVKAYAEIVRNKAQERRIGGKLQDLILCDKDAPDLIDAIEQIVEEERHGNSKDPYEEQKNALIAYTENIYKPFDKSTCIWTGWKTIDKTLHGLKKGYMSYVGAPPSTGKTTFALNVAQHQILKTQNRVLFFSLEMSREQLYDRLYSSMCAVPYDDIQSKSMEREQQDKIAQTISKVYENKQLFVFDDIYTLEEITAKVYELRPSLVIVDYIQTVQTVEKFKTRREQVDHISQSFKRLARKTGAHVMVLSQVARQVDRDGKPKPPRMSDLKESGNLEADGDYIMMLFRPYVYNKDSNKYSPEQASVLIDKNKYGNAGMLSMIFRGSVQTFEEAERRYDDTVR